MNRVKRSFMLVTCLIMVVSLVGCKSKTEQVSEIVMKLTENQKISQKELDKAIVSYKAMSEEDKQIIENISILDRYESVAIDKVYSLQNKLDELGEYPQLVDIVGLKPEYDAMNQNEKALIKCEYDLSKLNGIDANAVDKLNKQIGEITTNTKFSDVRIMKEAYDKMSSNEQSFIRNYEKVTEKFETNNLEKAAVSAAKYIRKSLKDKGSLTLNSVSVVDDTKGGSKYYLVKINFAAANSFGGKQNQNSLQTISETNYENPWWSLSLLSGKYSTALECSSFNSFYLKGTAVSLDVDKITYYIDK